MPAGRPFCILLAVCLGLTSAAAGHVRSALQTGQVIVICTGAGLTTITLDPDGAPVAPRAPCPDCTLVAVGPAPDQPAPDARNAIWRAAPTLPSPIAGAAPAPARPPPARGPPIL